MCKKILVTLDGSSVSEAILPDVAHLAGPDTRVILMTVSEMPKVERGTRPTLVTDILTAGSLTQLSGKPVFETLDKAMERTRAERSQYLSKVARQLKEAGIEVEIRVEFGHPSEQIVEAARQENVDVIAMATHGRTGLSEAVFGSVTGEVVRSGVKPVLLIRPK